MKKTLTISAAAISAAIAIAGCSTGSGADSSGSGGMPGMSHGSSATSSTSAPATSAEFNDADRMFAQMMTPHHAQAVAMSETILNKDGIPAAITDLATKIKAAQGPEIEKMTGWLQSRGLPTQMPNDMASTRSMSGIMSEDAMAKLGAAHGTDAAKLFLTQMIAHHEGAVMMAKTETTDGRNAEAIRLSEEIVSSQETEIQEMKDLLTKL